jgi:hypothetical protein
MSWNGRLCTTRQCMVPQGTGAGYSFTVVARNVQSAPTQQKFSYDAPIITSVLPVRVLCGVSSQTCRYVCVVTPGKDCDDRRANPGVWIELWQSCRPNSDTNAGGSLELRVPQHHSGLVALRTDVLERLVGCVRCWKWCCCRCGCCGFGVWFEERGRSGATGISST